MPKNTIRKPKNETQQGQGLDKLLAMFASGDNIPSSLLPKLVLLVGAAILYIANNHFASRTTLKNDKLKNEVSELVVDYTTMKSEFMMHSKQSRLAERVEFLGLKESDRPPYKLELDKNDPLIAQPNQY